VNACEFPDRSDLLELIHSISDININKLANRTIIANTCNSARKLQHTLVEHIANGIVHEQDCVHHLHNGWINGASKTVSAFLYVFLELEDSLENISLFLQHVSPGPGHIIQAFQAKCRVSLPV